MKLLIIRYRYGYYSLHPANPQFCANCSWKTCFFRPTTPTSPSSDPMVLQLTQLVAPSSHTSYQPLKLVPTCSSEQAFSWSVFQQDQVLLSYTSEQLACFQRVLSIFFPSLTVLTREPIDWSRLPFPVLVCKLHSCTEQGFFIPHQWTARLLSTGSGFFLSFVFPRYQLPFLFCWIIEHWSPCRIRDKTVTYQFPPSIPTYLRSLFPLFLTANESLLLYCCIRLPMNPCSFTVASQWQQQ